MKPLPRFPTRLGVRPALGAMLLMTACAAGAQQWTQGQVLWNANGCLSCHASVFPLSVMQASYANNSVALSRLNTAISAQPGMAQYRPGGATPLTDAQRNSLSYFISNFRAEGAVFFTSGGPTLTVPSTSQTAQATVRLQNNGKAILRVNRSGGQSLTGDTAHFGAVMGVGNGCDAQDINPAAFCEVTVTYRPQAVPAVQHTVTLVFAHNGEENATSSIVINGRVSASAPPSSPAASGGGGALSALWLALLPAALRRRRTA